MIRVRRISTYFTAILFLLAIFSGCKQKSHVDQSDEQQVVRNQRLSIIFGGDVMQHMPQVNAARTTDGFDYTECFSMLKPIFDTVDLVAVNLETVVAPDGCYSGYPRFGSPRELVEGLADAGVDILSLANNHICDRGKDGIDATIAAIDSAEMLYIGAYCDSVNAAEKHPLRIEKNGIRLALLNFTYGTNGLNVPAGKVVNLTDTMQMIDQLRLIDRSQTDCVVAIMHWGDEYSRKPNDEQRLLADLCRRYGVELIIGSHPHVVQPVEAERDSLGRIRALTAFSLGNLVSNQTRRYTDGGMLLKVDIHKSDSTGISFDAAYIPTWVYKRQDASGLKYTILPTLPGDTIPDASSEDQRRYLKFLEDTRELLRSHIGINEMSID